MESSVPNNNWRDEGGEALIIQKVWEFLLDSEKESLYWSEIENRYYKRNMRIVIFLAIVTSSTVGNWLILGGLDIVWKTLSGTSAVVAVILPILNYNMIIEESCSLRMKWTHIQCEYDYLHTAISTRSIKKGEILK